MSQSRTIIVALVCLMVGFAGGYALRPVIAPTQFASVADTVSSEPRGTQYFAANVDEARRVVAGCRDGSVRGGECATAEEAIIKVDAAERRRKFLGN